MNDSPTLFAPRRTGERPSLNQKMRSAAATHPLCRRVAQIAAASGIVLATLAVAAPSWAGPMSGC